MLSLDGQTRMLTTSDAQTFQILHRQPEATVEAQWRASLIDSDYPSHYTAPEFFLEPGFRDKRPFAILSMVNNEVTGVVTGCHESAHVQLGLSVRPQIALSKRADPARVIANLVAGICMEAKSAKLVDLFVWSDCETLVNSRFRKRRYEGVVMLDLSRGPDPLFRKFSENKRRNIKRAIKYGISVKPATSPDEIFAYYAVYADWSRRKALPILTEEEFQEIFALTNNRRLLLARYGDKIIAGLVIRFYPGGIMEYAANSSRENTLHLKPNDLLHWRAIEWGYQEGMIKYSLGGTHLFLRKFGGSLMPTTRCRLDLSILRKFTISDWMSNKMQQARPFIPEDMIALGRSLGKRMTVRNSVGRRST